MLSLPVPPSAVDSLHLITSARQQPVHFRNDVVSPGEFHVADTLPADDALLIDDIHIRNEFDPAVQLIGDLPGIQKVRIRDLDWKRGKKFTDLLLGVAG